MSKAFAFPRDDVWPSYFINALQEVVSAGRLDFRISKKSATTIQVIPDPQFGIAALNIDSKYRWITATIERVHPGGAKATYTIWATAKKDEIDDSPKTDTDHTDRSFALAITSGAEPVADLVMKVGELDWSGAEIEAIRQTYGSIPGPMIEDGALSSSGTSDITWTRDSTGALVAGLKANSVGASELADNSVDTNAIIALAVTEAKIAAEAITAGKLAPNSVTAVKIAALAVETAKIAALAVTAEKLGGEAVETAKIKALAVTAAKLAAEAVETGKIANLAVTAAKLAADAVETVKIKDEAVTLPKMAKAAKPFIWYARNFVEAEETRTNTAYGVLTTPDRVSGIKWNPGQLLVILFHGLWRQTVTEKARAAFFITREGGGGGQARVGYEGNNSTPAAAFAGTGANGWANLVSSPIGLQSTGNVAGTAASSLEFVPFGAISELSFMEEVGTLKGLNGPNPAGTRASMGGFFIVPCPLAGNWTVEVQYKSITEGTVAAKQRSLHCFVVGPEP